MTLLPQHSIYNNKQENATKRLAAIRKLILKVIPQEPSLPEYRQGKTLGDKHKHWFRAKFFQQYRLFFRYHASSKTIIYAWVNDEKALRAYGSKINLLQYKIFSNYSISRFKNNGSPSSFPPWIIPSTTFTPDVLVSCPKVSDTIFSSSNKSSFSDK